MTHFHKRHLLSLTWTYNQSCTIKLKIIIKIIISRSSCIFRHFLFHYHLLFSPYLNWFRETNLKDNQNKSIFTSNFILNYVIFFIHWQTIFKRLVRLLTHLNRPWNELSRAVNVHYKILNSTCLDKNTLEIFSTSRN